MSVWQLILTACAILFSGLSILRLIIVARQTRRAWEEAEQAWARAKENWDKVDEQVAKNWEIIRRIYG